MSIYVGPGEDVEGEGCRPSIYIYIDICTGTCVDVFLYRMYIYDIYIWTYLSFCVYTCADKYSSVYFIQNIVLDTNEIVYMCTDESI